MPHFENLDTLKSLSPDWLRMQSDFYLCSTGLLEGRRETAFGGEKNALQRFLMIQKRTGGITGLNNGKKKIFWHEPLPSFNLLKQSSSSLLCHNPQVHRAIAIMSPCNGLASRMSTVFASIPPSPLAFQLRLTISSPASSISSSKLWLQSRDKQHFILCGQVFTESFS